MPVLRAPHVPVPRSARCTTGPAIRDPALCCFADVTDIGDTSYSAVLVDDVDNDGLLELLLTTMSGHVYSFGTPAEYHPLKTWPQAVPGQANFVARHDMVRCTDHSLCLVS